MKSESGKRLRNNSNLPSRDVLLLAAARCCTPPVWQQDPQKRTPQKICLDLTSDLLYSEEMTSNLSEGRFQQEAGTAGLGPLSSDDLTEKKTDWINHVAGIMWPCEVGL